ncbi:MAG: class A sortase [Bacillota bacterium]
MREKRKKKKSRFLYNLLFGLVLIVGILFMCYEPIKNWITSIGVSSINVVSAADIEANKTKQVSFNFEEVENIDLNTLIKASLYKDKIAVMGEISIPSVNLNLAVGKGTSNNTLALTAGTMKEDQVMGEGNYALAGHHMKRKDLLFSPLFDVKMGANAYLTDLRYVYEYQIDEQRTIQATEVEVIEDVEGEKRLTLVTCDNDGEDRLLTRGHFVRKIPIEEASKEMVEALQLERNDQ